MLLYLDILAYFPELSRNGYTTVGDFIDDYLISAPENRPTTMFNDYKSDEVTGVVSLVEHLSNIRQIRDLKISVDSSDTNKYNAVCLTEDNVSSDNSISKRFVYVILGANYREHLYDSFYGKTSTWADNFLGAIRTETAEQKSILHFYDRAISEVTKGTNEFTNIRIIVSGHSKAGNLAQYITIMRDNVDLCISFDGEGFSDKFIHKYRSRIYSNSRKIISISPDMSIAGCLLKSLPKTKKYYIKTGYMKDRNIPLVPIYYHVPTTLLDKEGFLKPFARGYNCISDMLHFISVISVKISALIPFVNCERGLKGIGEAIRHIFKGRILQGIKEIINKDTLTVLFIGSLAAAITAPIFVGAQLIVLAFADKE